MISKGFSNKLFSNKGCFTFFVLFFVFVLVSYSNEIQAQLRKPSKEEKSFIKLYNIGEWKKCNQLAKQYIKKHQKEDVAFESACYYAALSYLKYDMWDFNKRNVLNEQAWIMDRKPLNYIDSAFRYNQLFMEASEAMLSDTAHKWRHELFPELFNSVRTEIVQRKFNKYYKEEKEHLYENYKLEFEQVFGWYENMINITHHYFPWLESNLYVSFLDMRHNCGLPISNDELNKMRALIEDQIKKYKCGNNVPENEFITVYCRDELEMLLELDTTLFFDYVRMYERNDIPVGFGPSSNFYINKKIWKFKNNKIDLGTIYISDNTHYLKNAFDTTITVNILSEIYPDDTLRFLSIEREHENRFECIQFTVQPTVFASGATEHQLQLNFKLKNNIYINKEHQWHKIEERYDIKSNRGSDYLHLIYRLQHRN